jgi:hypothetical protein
LRAQFIAEVRAQLAANHNRSNADLKAVIAKVQSIVLRSHACRPEDDAA